ncbi:MAG: lysophospholipase [Anaerolineales bacterium]|nr:lysophospholipase [Anaerolineales bacterium]
MQHYEFGWQTDDGLQLYAQGWQPETEPKGVICLVHGLGEHNGRYAHLAAFLNQAGYALLTFDLRGHGKSEGPRGHAPSYEALLDDIAHLLEEAAARYPDRPCFLYGHSLGGNLVIGYALRRRPQLAGVIATGPFLRAAFEPPAWKLSLARIMYSLWPTLSLSNGLDRQALSRDPEVVRAYNNDPLVHDRLSARLGMDMLQSGLQSLERAAEFPLPLLLMHGSDDHITSPQASREFAAQAGERCTLKIWDSFYHEIHNEPEREQVFEHLSEWLMSNE